ncbi:hypothetical protein DMR_09840 [Solidesulfovibrio magneticus RS-1]|uniref:Uncharacterized protein n=1 Tax=Solidesulfovibrio magneticus (strain ATCC 700980 / DSM 13731 / RS-1) TaxID=573370 RepID=C4XKT6_SOLM1|nr:hypothetical protein DMR_09840 [Solidesulfovibrio magneticus RS-1]
MVFVVFVKDISNFQHRIPIDSFLQTSVALGGISFHLHGIFPEGLPLVNFNPFESIPCLTASKYQKHG